MTTQATTYRFGAYELRVRTRELYKQGVKLRLRPQPTAVLTLLLEQAGNVVTREKLQERVWMADTFVDFEHGLNTVMKEAGCPKRFGLRATVYRDNPQAGLPPDCAGGN